MAKDNKNVLMIILIVVALVIGGGIGFIITKSVSPASESEGTTAGNRTTEKAPSIELYPPSIEEVEDDWIVTIDDYAFRFTDFEESYELMESQISQLIVQYYGISPTESQMKEVYLEQLIPTYVLAIKALDEGIMEDEENRELLQSAIIQSLGTLYLETIIPEDDDYFTPTNLEIEEYYTLYKDQLLEYKTAYGLTATELKELVSAQVQQQKLQLWQEEIIEQAKEEYKVKKNTDKMDDLGISSDLDTDIGLDDLTLPGLE